MTKRKSPSEIGQPSLRLDTMPRVRRELVSIYKAAKFGMMDVNKASKLTFILQAIVRLIEGGELAGRLEALEKLAAEAERVRRA